MLQRVRTGCALLHLLPQCMLQLGIPHSLDALPLCHVPCVKLHHLPADLIAQTQGMLQDALRAFVPQTDHLVPAIGWTGGTLNVRNRDEMR